MCGLATVGVVRGEERPYNEVLDAAVADGMQLHYLDRATYRRKNELEVVEALHRRFGDFYLVPEGAAECSPSRAVASSSARSSNPST
jgi:1-aminocyclopropane-1-carboxylate deaminase